MSEERISVIDRLRIFEVRGRPVVLDSDLAGIYGVETKVLNQAVKRNAERFPDDFLFRLTPEEWTSLRSQFVTLKTAHRGAHRKYAPLALTEHGAIMAATILNSPRAVAMSVSVVRALVRLRNELLASTSLEKRLAHIEKTLLATMTICATSTRRSGHCWFRPSRSAKTPDWLSHRTRRTRITIVHEINSFRAVRIFRGCQQAK